MSSEEPSSAPARDKNDARSSARLTTLMSSMTLTAERTRPSASCSALACTRLQTTAPFAGSRLRTTTGSTSISPAISRCAGIRVGSSGAPASSVTCMRSR